MLGPVPSALGFGPDVIKHGLVTYSRMSLAFAIHEICVIAGFTFHSILSAKWKVNSVVSGLWDINKDVDSSFNVGISVRGTVEEC